MPNYWESRWGTRAAPIILEAAQGRGSVTLAGMNVFDVRHLYLIGLTLASEFEPFHCERCTNLLLRNVTARGICPQGYTTNCGVQEAIKLNQCQGVWVENVGAPWCGARGAAWCCAVHHQREGVLHSMQGTAWDPLPASAGSS